MDRTELEALKEFVNQRIIEVFDALGIDYNESHRSITAPCPIHGGEREDAFSWHMDYNIFQCFSRGCQNKHGKDIFGLIRGVLDCSFPEAIKFVKDLFSGEDMGNTKDLIELKENKKFIAKVNRKEIKKYPERVLDKLAYSTYLETRNYPKKLIESYRAGVSPAKHRRMSNRVIFPIRNIEGDIIGFTGRTLLENWRDLRIGKWEHSPGFDKEHSLFNIDRAARHIMDSGTAILVEGPLDVLRLEQAGVHNGVAIFGRTLYNGQISLLIQAGANNLLLALDADDAGKTGAEGALITAQSFFKINNIDLGDGDVGDLTIEQVREIFGTQYAI